QYCAPLHAALGRRGHPGRRRVRRRPGLAYRGGDRRDHLDARRLLPLFPPPQPRLADRRPGRDPDPGAGTAPACDPRGAGELMAPIALPAGIATLIRKPWIWSFVATVAVWLAMEIFTGGQGAG